jgi:membrane protein
VGGSSIYGPLATPIVILIWLYVLAIAVLIGAALNAAIEVVWPSRVTTQARVQTGAAPIVGQPALPPGTLTPVLPHAAPARPPAAQPPVLPAAAPAEAKPPSPAQDKAQAESAVRLAGG